MIPRPVPLQRAVLAVVAASALLLGLLAGTAPAQAATTVVTGTITSFDGRPVSTGVELYVNIAEPDQAPLWSSTQQVFSDENGVYRFDEGLDATQYRIGVAPQSLSSYDEETGETTFTNLAPVFHPAARTVESATTVKVPAGRTTTVDITSPEGGVVSGTVTGQPDLRHDNLAVIAQYRDPATGTWGTAGFAPVFEEDHAYDLVLQPGSYKLRFYDGNGYHYTEYWNDAATRDAGQDVTVTAGGTLPGVDAELARAGRIEGRLTLASGAPVDTDNSFTTIERRDPATGTWSQVDDVDGGYLDAEGRFGFGPLVAGTYRVKAVSNKYPDTYYGGGTEGTPITVETSQVVTGIDLSLTKPGSVSGAVQLPTGKAAPGATVVVYAKAESGTWTQVDESSTDSRGGYVIGDVPAGTYAVQVFPGNPAYAPQVYLGKTSLDAGTPVTVKDGTRTRLSTVKLAAGATVSGTITLPKGVSDRVARTVDVIDPASGDLVSSVVASKRGSGTSWTYAVPGLAAGSYQVQFARSSGSSLATGQFFKNVPETQGRASATAVKVTAGKTTPSVNATLRTGATITGRVLDTRGEPLRCSVLAVSADGTLTTRSAVSSSSTGTFTISGLSAGQYKVLVQGDESACVADPQSNDETSGYYFDGDDTAGRTTWDPAQANLVTVEGTGTSALADQYYGPVEGDTFDSAPAPTVTGKAAVGSRLASDTAGDATPGQDGIAYQWLRNGKPISGATETGYTVVAADAGTVLTVRYTWRKEGYVDVVTASRDVKIGASNLAKPTISGTPAVGRTLKAARGTWAGTGWTYGYQWYRGDAAIKGATASTYTPTRSDRSKTLTVRVTARKTGFASATAASAGTKVR